MASIDSQYIKVAPFISEDTGVDGNKKINGRKRHVVTDTLGLIWAVVVHAANQADGATAERVVAGFTLTTIFLPNTKTPCSLAIMRVDGFEI